MSFLSRCLLTFFLFQGALAVAGNRALRRSQQGNKALLPRLSFGQSNQSSSSVILNSTAQPSTPSGNASKVVGGYWEGWNIQNPCGTMRPEEIPVDLYTHLMFSFGFITPKTYAVQPAPGTEESLFTQVVDVKKRNPNLKVIVALGGWTHTDPGPYRAVFTNLVSSSANRATFIKNLLAFLAKFNFDGVDLDWEYPGVADRGGRPTDKENLAKLLQEIRQAFQNQYTLSIAAPLPPVALENYDMKATSEAVDWINVMAYDLHGLWESDKRAWGHTNMTDISKGLNQLLQAGVAPSKMVLGLGFYGRSFKMANPGCTRPGCKFTGPGDGGPCTRSAGTLAYHEIKDLIAHGAKPVFDQPGAAKYLSWGGNTTLTWGGNATNTTNWISYDDSQTLRMKMGLASTKGLRGVMSWAIDMDDQQRSLGHLLSSFR
ncbi:glycoside hydrolase superfamily [Aspergillus coremiiformis]|uniref:chitinase n=1 Tax=Aspergillus coremiiformis TaxID=138285 RepID=A0A5N6YWL4_9EURO|nr:glycoside hydrolase superfamily [Aspergillus coremiiformis]